MKIITQYTLATFAAITLSWLYLYHVIDAFPLGSIAFIKGCSPLVMLGVFKVILRGRLKLNWSYLLVLFVFVFYSQTFSIPVAGYIEMLKVNAAHSVGVFAILFACCYTLNIIYEQAIAKLVGSAIRLNQHEKKR